MVIHHQREETLKAISDLPHSLPGPGGTKTNSKKKKKVEGEEIIVKIRNASEKKIKLVLSASTVLPLQISFGDFQQLTFLSLPLSDGSLFLRSTRLAIPGPLGKLGN